MKTEYKYLKFVQIKSSGKTSKKKDYGMDFSKK